MKFSHLVCILLCVHSGLSGQVHTLLKDIGTGTSNGIPQANKSTTWNGLQYFIGFDESGLENDIWSTDGTPANTKRVVPSNYPEISFLTSVRNGLLFNAWVGANRELYVSNATPGGTQLIADFPGQEIIFLEALNDSIAIFITREFLTDITSIWATDGTTMGTVNLGEYEVLKFFLRYSFYDHRMVFTEKSTNGTLFSPVITDGTIEGTMLVSDYLNSMITPDVMDVRSAVGTSDHLFVQASGGGKVFDGTSLNDFPLGGDYYHGFKLDHLHIVFSSAGIRTYNDVSETSADIFFDNEYFSEPVSSGEKVFFHDFDSYVYETDGTAANTRKIGTVSVGFLNFDPYLFANTNSVIYNVVESGMTSLRIVDLTSGVDSLFSEIRPSGVVNFDPHIFASGNHIVYTKATPTNGREYWSYTPLETGVFEFPEIDNLTSFPNPATDWVRVSGKGDFQQVARIQLVNSSGQRLPGRVLSSQPLTIDVAGLQAGLYWIWIREVSGVSYRSAFIKQ